MIEYYCSKCEKVVSPVQGEFKHPHLGMKSCLKCPDCGTMVYAREKTSEI